MSLVARATSAASFMVVGAVLGAIIRPTLYLGAGFTAGWLACQHYKGDLSALQAESAHAALGAARLLSDAAVRAAEKK